MIVEYCKCEKEIWLDCFNDSHDKCCVDHSTTKGVRTMVMSEGLLRKLMVEAYRHFEDEFDYIRKYGVDAE